MGVGSGVGYGKWDMASEFPSMTCKHEAAESGMTNVEDHERQNRSDRIAVGMLCKHSWACIKEAHLKSFACHAESTCGRTGISMRRDQTCKPHTFLLETPHMLLHGCKAAMLMPSVEEKMLFPAESAERSGRCAR